MPKAQTYMNALGEMASALISVDPHPSVSDKTNSTSGLGKTYTVMLDVSEQASSAPAKNTTL